MSARPAAILLMGPTASGKTDLAIELSRHYPLDLISVDSALIYRGMDIGTAKPDAATLRRHPHALIDILDPAESYSAWQFVRDATGLILRSHEAGRIPLLVGGTMLYFHALQQGMNELPESDPVLRAELEAERKSRGLKALYRELVRVDAASAARIRPGDRQRILRALEVHRLTGQPLSRLQATAAEAPAFDFIPLLLDAPDRSLLHRRIEQRFARMLEQGFEAEVRALRARGDLHPDLPSMRCVGYRQMWSYLEGNLERDRMVERAVIATRQLAKRQLTWLRKYPNRGRFDCAELDTAAIRHYLDDELAALP
jgi:tRNA dimethylallyltransferase